MLGCVFTEHWLVCLLLILRITNHKAETGTQKYSPCVISEYTNQKMKIKDDSMKIHQAGRGAYLLMGSSVPGPGLNLDHRQ